MLNNNNSRENVDWHSGLGVGKVSENIIIYRNTIVLKQLKVVKQNVIWKRVCYFEEFSKAYETFADLNFVLKQRKVMQ